MFFEMPDCGACRTCEIACSFHHIGEFKPSVSSLKVLDTEEGKGKTIFFAEKDDGDTLACDGCGDREEPLCMAVCEKKEELAGMLEVLLREIDKSTTGGPSN